MEELMTSFMSLRSSSATTEEKLYDVEEVMVD